MKIQEISVEGLFGIFDHVISLNLDERITIIHGPNGFGKTAILRMLNGFFNSRYSVFKTIPCSKFRIDFDNGDAVRGFKKIDIEQKEFTRFIYESEQNQDPDVFDVARDGQDLDFEINTLDGIDDIIPSLRRVGVKSWRYLPTGETLSLNEVIDRFEDFLPLQLRLRQEPDWLKGLKKNINVRLIESQRLLNVVSNQSMRMHHETPSMLSTVSAYSDEIAELIQAKLTEYGTTSQSLDRTFPARVVKQQPSPDVTEEKLRTQLAELEEKRSRLIQVGLLDQEGNSDFQIQPGSIDETTQNILSVYIQDVEKKLSVFKEVFRKIELLRTIINKKFSYSYKEMNFSKEAGFVFSTNLPVSSSPKTISPTDLSSGEQHELVLLYELLFKVQPNSLVLIDEPELSLHVGWQSQFLQDLKEITKLADLDVLMATHSPDIIQDRWDLTVELKGPET